MNNKLINKALCFMCLICVLITSSCKKDELNTDQMGSGKITLKAFGPSPALRGGELRFIGTNMDKVTAVILPAYNAEIEIAASAFTKREKTEIRVLIPQDADVGHCILKTPQGDIRTITVLTYSDPVSISSITTATLKAGQEFEIEGEYLNLMKEVIFKSSGQAVVMQADFVSQTRSKIVVTVPINARSGVVTISNGAEMPIEVFSTDEASIVEPSITGFTPETVKAGGNVTITGKDFDLVDSVYVAPYNKAEIVSKSETSITVNIPADAQDGPITLVAWSGAEVFSSTDLTLKMPVITTATDPVKNGGKMEFTGTDLDLVTAVLFDKLEAKFEYADGKITVTEVPMTANSDFVNLVTTSTKVLKVEGVSYVEPNVTAYNPQPVIAGAELKLQGTDLDLVVEVTFVNNLVVPVESGTANELTVTVPIDALSGVVVLTMTNGQQVDCPSLDITETQFAYLREIPDPEAEIKAGEILIVELGNSNALTEVQVSGKTTKYLLEGSKLFILIPGSVSGDCKLKLISSTGDITYTITILPAIVETVIWEGIQELSWSAYAIPKSKFGDPEAGDRLRFYFLKLGDEPKIKFYYGDWDGPIILNDPNFVAGGDADLLGIPAGSNYYDIVLTAEMINKIQNPAWGSDGLLLMGEDVTIFKMSILTGSEPATVLWEGSIAINWDDSHSVFPLDVSLLIPGKTLGIDFEVDPGGGSMEVMGGTWWEALPSWEALNGGERNVMQCAASDTNVEFTITQADIDCISKQGAALLICGGGVTINRLYIK